MFDKKEAIYIFLAIIVLLLIAAGILLFVKMSETENISAGTVQEENNSFKEIKYCDSNEDCDDENSCTIEDCREGVCFNVKVLLCYANDGCCPENCNQRNDNDCLS